MFVRGVRRVALVVVWPLLILLFISLKFYNDRRNDMLPWPAHGAWQTQQDGENGPQREPLENTQSLPTNIPIAIPDAAGDDDTPSNTDGLSGAVAEEIVVDNIDMSITHHQIFSVSTADKKYFHIDFGEYQAINPSIITHPTLPNTYIIVGQKHKSAAEENSIWFAELVCNAAFTKDGSKLKCIAPPVILPIAATTGDASKCTGDLSFFPLNIGPHDARVFYGPDSPYTIYGSNSALTCFGQWILDFRLLVDWGYQTPTPDRFHVATELQRPLPYGAVEKNWFVFWDKNQQLYAHYDVAPKRVFAKLELDGSVGPDLSELSGGGDEICMQRYMPRMANEEHESIHQATNSVSITLCKRSEAGCEPNDDNTFILSIFQHKSFYAFHSVYEPYAMLFRRSAPFEIHAISSKPIWINGRGKPGQGKKPDVLAHREERTGEKVVWDQTEMLYVTSLTWKSHELKYHGHGDDVLFIGFGIEDSATGGIDVLAAELLQDMNNCADITD